MAICCACISFARPSAAFRSGRDLADLEPSERVAFLDGNIPVVLSRTVPKGLLLADVESAIKSALLSWSAPSCSAVLFDYQGTTTAHATPGDRLNTIEWVTDWSARSFPKDAAGATDVQYEKQAGGEWKIVEADMYLNATFHWATPGAEASSERDVQSVVTHEAGHLLGLLHPCEPGGADGAPDCASNGGAPFLGTAMFPIYSLSEQTLSQDDIDGACFLYPQSPCPAGGCADGTTCTTEGCRALCGSAQDTVCAVGDLCDGTICRQPNLCVAASCLGMACAAQAECGSRETCLDGKCVHGSSAVGDPCTVNTDCDSTACAGGYCAAPCNVDADCASGDTCNINAKGCTGKLLGLGQHCKDASGCAGGLCVAGAGKEPVCSRSCGDSLPACPNGWGCDTADGKNACAPNATSSGCSVGVAPAQSSSLFLTSFFLGLFLRITRKRSARRS